MNVAVLGGGDGARATAAELALAGHRVRLWGLPDADAAAIREAGGAIRLGAMGQSPARLERVAPDLPAAVAGVEVVIVALPATVHRDLAGQVAGLLGEEQIVLLTPGTFGSYVMAREIARGGGRLPLAFAETGAFACFARRPGPAAVAAPVRAANLPTGVFPAARAPAVLDRLGALFPAIQPCRDVLDAALTSAGPVVQPPRALLNAAAIDEGTPPVSGMTPSLRRLIDAVNGERMAIRAGLGFPDPHDALPATERAEVIAT